MLAKDLIAGLGSAVFTSIALSGAAVASLAHFLLLRGVAGLMAPAGFLWLAAATGVLATVIPSFLVNAGMSRIGPQSTATISTLSPLLTIYFATLFLGEDFSLVDGLGTALVFAGVGYHTWRDLQKTPS